MWIETQDGELVNVDFVKYFYIKGKLILAEFADGGNVAIAEYQSEENIKKAVGKFEEKLRRTGKRIFKFDKESEKNDAH